MLLVVNAGTSLDITARILDNEIRQRGEGEKDTYEGLCFLRKRLSVRIV
ncbi:MAG: hypothetical protein FWB78_08275 [Treponema sp.]|nr:hypothetical protein [Treponema sp.]